MKRKGSGKSQFSERGLPLLRSQTPTVKPRNTGLTLVELVIVIALVAILVELGVPAARGMLNTSESAAVMLKVQSMLQLARSQAVTDQQEITFCGTTDGSTCNREWYGKTLVFADSNKNRTLDAGEPLYADEPIEISGRLRWRASAGRHYLRFSGEGWAKEFGTLTYCPQNGRAQHAKALIVSFTGRTRASRDTDGDGIREDSRGRPLSCT